MPRRATTGSRLTDAWRELSISDPEEVEFLELAREVTILLREASREPRGPHGGLRSTKSLSPLGRMAGRLRQASECQGRGAATEAGGRLRERSRFWAAIESKEYITSPEHMTMVEPLQVSRWE